MVTKKITQKTKALLIPNLIGNIPDWTKIYKIAKKYNLKIIEDSADTLGGTIYNKPTGFYSDASITSSDGVLLTIKRASCSKYGDGLKIIYINKYGAQQDLWFFLKNSKQIARTNEGYKSNIITYPSNSGAIYNQKNAANKVFNTQGKQTHSLSSGYYPEASNQLFEELLLSEHVWLEVFYRGKPAIVPVKVINSSIQFKTQINDRLIQYTMEFEEAFDYINNIR